MFNIDIFPSIFRYIIFSILLASPVLNAAPPIKKLAVAIWGPPAEIFKDKGFSVTCSDINDYIKTDERRRDITDLLIFCSAFNVADVDIEFDFVISSSYKQALSISKNNYVHAVSFTVWNKDIDTESFYSTAPVIEEGDYQKGIYTLPSHPLQQLPAAKRNGMLKSYTMVTVKDWLLDRKASLSITNNIKYSSSYLHLFSMLNAGMGDMTLLGFGPNKDLSQTKGAVTLLPVQGVKIAFYDSRHFIVKKTAPNAKLLIDKLNQGLKKLKSSGYIRDRYRYSGLYKKEAQAWEVLNISSKTQH